MAKLTSFEADIRPLFTERDIHGMSKAFNLASYDEVKAHAAAIKDRIRGIGGAVMPPPPPKGEGTWPQSRIDLFIKWVTGAAEKSELPLRRKPRRAMQRRGLKISRHIAMSEATTQSRAASPPWIASREPPSGPATSRGHVGSQSRQIQYRRNSPTSLP